MPNTYAQSAKDLAKQSFKKGRKAYKNKKYPQALKAFQAAYQKYPIPMMLFNIASTYEAMKQFPLALQYYKDLVATGKDDGDAAKKVKSLSKKLSKWARVQITSHPTDAEIYVNHTHYAPWGKTPDTFLLPPNKEITLYLKAKGYQTLVYPVRFKTKEKKKLNLKLKGKSAFVRIMGAPKGLTAQINNKILKGLPIIYDLGVGRHEIALSADGYLPEKRTVVLSAIHTRKAPLSLEVKLRSSKGLALLVLKVEQSDVTLFIDGIPQKQGPFINPIEVKSGEHLIEIRDQQGKVFRRKVQFKAGQTETLEVDLLQSSFFTRKRVSFTLLSAGGASLIAGMVSSFLAASASGDLEECRTQFACARKQGELDLAQDVRGYALSADIFTGLGVLLGAGGGILYWLDQSQTTTVPQVQVVPNGAGATAITQFTF